MTYNITMNLIRSVILILSGILSTNSDWVRIPDVAPQQSPNDLLTIDPDIPFTTSIKPLKYEDLEHIIGPGFEDELEKFYEKHKQEIVENLNDPQSQLTTISSNRNETLDHRTGSWTVHDISKNKKLNDKLDMESYVTDSWSIYDKYPIKGSISPIKNDQVTSSESNEKIPSTKPTKIDGKIQKVVRVTKQSVISQVPKDNKPKLTQVKNNNKSAKDKGPQTSTTTQKSVRKEHIINVASTTKPIEQNKNKTNSKTRPAYQRFKFIKVFPAHQPNLSFSGFLQFLKHVQKSFVGGAARNIKDKIEMLQDFRDTLLLNIRK